MKLYVCYGTWKPAPRPGGHPCGNAYHALRDAGYDPEVIRSYGLGWLPGALNGTPGRREVKRLTGNHWVPVLVTDDGAVIQDSRKIAEWAKANPAPAASPARGGIRDANDQADEPVTGDDPVDVARTPGSLTVEYLESWELHGASWRPLELSRDHVVVELCTCYGEPVDVLQGEGPELIEYVRAHRAD